MRATLVIIGGKANKSQVSLNLPTVIGRSRDADLTVAHPMISRQHCELYDADGLLMVRDLGSLNGTFVDGRQITEAGLRPEDEFSIGPLTFRVDYEHAEPATSPPEAPGETNVMTESDVDAESPDFDLASRIVVQSTAQAAEVDETIPTSGLATQGASDSAADSEEDGAPEIAPADAQLPDFSQWGKPIDESTMDAASPEGADQPEPPSQSDGDDDSRGFLDGLS